MPFPRDWPWRWWLRPGETAAVLKLPNRPAMPLIFTADDTKLWEFQLGEHRPVYDHRNGHFAFGLDRAKAGDVVDAVKAVAARLMGDTWQLSPNEQTIVDLIAKELPNGAEVSAMTLRFQLRKHHGIDDDESAYLLGRLYPRHIFRVEGSDDDVYRLTVPGLFASSEAPKATNVVLSVLKVLEAEFEKKQTFADFSLDQVMEVGALEEDDRLFTAHAIPLLKLSPSAGTRSALTPPKVSWSWRRPDDIEALAIGGPSLAAFWKATAKGTRVERPWLSAPLRLKETMQETERRTRVGEVYVRLTHDLTRADLPPTFGPSSNQFATEHATAPIAAERSSARRDEAATTDGKPNTILFLASNPTTDRLALDEEARDIEQKIRASQHRDSLFLKTRWAVRTDDLLQALNQDRPTVVHFSGHGSGTSGIVLHAEAGGLQLVGAAALEHLFRTLKDDIRLVVLNACYSVEQATALVRVIDCVVGMNDSVGDDAARTFSASFYRALGFGRNVRNAFDQGVAAIKLDGLHDDNVPVLLVREGVDAEQVVLVRSA